MRISKFLKPFGLFFSSIGFLTVILYLTVMICSLLGFFEEYIFCVFLGVFHSIVVLLLLKNITCKIAMSRNFYLLFTTFMPALIFDIICISFLNSNNTVSILDIGKSEIRYYFIFMSIAFSLSSIIIVIVKIFMLLKSFKK